MNFVKHNLLSMLLIVFLVFVLFRVEQLKKPPEIEVIYETEVIEVKIAPDVLYREEITVVIEKYRDVGQLDKIVHFYNGFVNNMELTYLILGASHLYKIPPNVLFALIFAESNFKEGAVNGDGNKDGSADYGLLQLNSRVFKGYTKDQLMDRHLNLILGSKHLRQRYDQYGTFDEAIMYYNGFSQGAVKHQARVLSKERELDRAFNMSGLASALE
ncbi:hypothetical protein LCGC14_0616920 [marine sediment metagenome]|uniref:Transglycosylase SLT domain-containing protein n=1 Tax=marine sediment metagenome TaxID=412755 RepID=A0A0F9R636_9ZZZZ